MRLTLDALAVLDAIDRKGSFAAAAEELYRVPSAITYTVQKLEQDLGVTVFDRGGHRARLTPAGQKLLGEGRRLLSLAEQLERAVKRVATGWEAELSIAVNDIIPLERLYPLLEDFYQEEHGTRLRITNEVLGGVWDALVSGRVDMAIGAPVEGPPGGGYASRPMGFMTFVFVVAPQHPLADIPEPLADETILQYRAVATADSSRNLPPRTSALFSGQDVLTVPNIEAKCEAHRRGLGVGYVPRHLVQEDLTSGRLIAKAVAGDIPIPRLSVAWRTARVGKALKWFLRRLEEPELLQEIMD
jgi:DNA-binding transcriptional LysR family regulator